MTNVNLPVMDYGMLLYIKLCFSSFMHCFCSIWFIIWIASYIVLNRVPLAISISMLECHWLSNVLLSMLDLMIVFSDSLINHWACMQLQLNKNLI